jgi:hypothetical protein
MDERDMVEWCLANQPETRNSDIELTCAIWVKFFGQYIKLSKDGEYAILLKDLDRVMRQDNVKRLRAKFNADGFYLPTDPDVRKQRRIAEDLWRKKLGYNTNNAQPLILKEEETR